MDPVDLDAEGKAVDKATKRSASIMAGWLNKKEPKLE